LEVINTIKGKQMNNPLAQKYNYYLNESYRLSEELKSEEAYSELLENILFELLGPEHFTKLFEVAILEPVTGYTDNPERRERRERRIKQIETIGRERAQQGLNLRRVASSLVAKGVDAEGLDQPIPPTSNSPWTPYKTHSQPSVYNVQNALNADKPLRMSDTQEILYPNHARAFSNNVNTQYGDRNTRAVRTLADQEQKRLGRQERSSRKREI